MNSDEDKHYRKLVAFDEIYNFVVETFFIWSHLAAKEKIYFPDLIPKTEIRTVYLFFTPRQQVEIMVILQSIRFWVGLGFAVGRGSGRGRQR
jgi:hypothetical protein